MRQRSGKTEMDKQPIKQTRKASSPCKKMPSFYREQKSKRDFEEEKDEGWRGEREHKKGEGLGNRESERFGRRVGGQGAPVVWAAVPRLPVWWVQRRWQCE